MKIVASASGQSYRIRANAMGGGDFSFLYNVYLFLFRDDLKQIC